MAYASSYPAIPNFAVEIYAWMMVLYCEVYEILLRRTSIFFL